MDEEQTLEEEILGIVEKLGLEYPLKPAREPSTEDRDITLMASKEVMEHMNYFSGMIAYAQSEVAKITVSLAIAKARYKNTRAVKYFEIKNGAGKITAKDLEYMLDMDEDLDELKQDEVASEGKQEIVKALLSGYESKFMVFSRELTRRGNPGTHKEF